MNRYRYAIHLAEDTLLSGRLVAVTVVLSLYARMFPAGQVVLGDNTPAGADRHSIYTVVIQKTP